LIKFSIFLIKKIMKLSLKSYSPIFGGSTGGWLRAAEIEEKYAITWTSPKEQTFEMPTGGAAVMLNEENLLYLARKEQCLALGTQLKTFKITDYKIYRIFPSGEVQFLHPKDGVFPEKVNPGRLSVGNRSFSIGNNPNPVTVKFSSQQTYES
jgi:photosystem I subunit 2